MVKQDEIYRLLVEPEPKDPVQDGAEESSVSSELVQRFVDSPFLGEVSAPDGYAHMQGECGDYMEVFLNIRDRRIRKARFDTLGCGYTVACGSMAMEMAEGRTLSEALRIAPERIAQELGGLPSSHEHCAELAAVTLRKAIEDYLTRGKDAWRKLYRNR